MSIVGNVYLLRGEPVMVTAQWRQQKASERLNLPLVHTGQATPRNVLVKREDGTETVRPFRGLQRVPRGRPDRPDRPAKYRRH